MGSTSDLHDLVSNLMHSHFTNDVMRSSHIPIIDQNSEITAYHNNIRVVGKKGLVDRIITEPLFNEWSLSTSVTYCEILHISFIENVLVTYGTPFKY